MIKQKQKFKDELELYKKLRKEGWIPCFMVFANIEKNKEEKVILKYFYPSDVPKPLIVDSLKKWLEIKVEGNETESIQDK